MSITDGDTVYAAHLHGSGAAFPTNPAPVNGQGFYRTDLNAWYRYLNSAWVQITGLNIGNFLVNSQFFDTNQDNIPDWWVIDGTPPTLAIAADTLCGFNDGHMQITITADAANEGIKIAGGTSNFLKVRPSTQYTFSVYYKATAGDNAGVKIKSYNGATGGTLHVNVNNLATTTATRYSVTFTTDADATNLEIELLAIANTDVVLFSHPQLEMNPSASAYRANDKLKQVSWGPTGMSLEFTTAVAATLTEVNGDADQVPLKSMAFTKSDVVFLYPEFDIPLNFSGLPVLLHYRFYAAAASKTHTMEIAFASRGLSDAKDSAVGGFTEIGQDTSDGTSGDEQIMEKLLTAAEIGWTAAREWAGYLRRKNAAGDDADEVYIKGLKIQYIEV